MVRLYLDKDLAFKSFWRGKMSRIAGLDAGNIQFVPQDVDQALGHLLLLGNAAVVLYGQDDRVARGGEITTHKRLELKVEGAAEDTQFIGVSGSTGRLNASFIGVEQPALEGPRVCSVVVFIYLQVLINVVVVRRVFYGRSL